MYNYSKYKEICDEINRLTNKLNKATEDDYNSYEVYDSTCRIIKYTNSLLAHMRHSKNK